jgi:hypothetical protein
MRLFAKRIVCGVAAFVPFDIKLLRHTEGDVFQKKQRLVMIDIISEPKGETYTALLRLAMNYCTLFSLTWRDQLEFSDSANEMLKILAPYLVREAYTDKWPGTQLLKSKAWVRYYRFTKETLEIIFRVPSLYAWCAPTLPEDLALYEADNRCWLLSIAHEQDAAIESAVIGVEDLKVMVPGLLVKVRV